MEYISIIQIKYKRILRQRCEQGRDPVSIDYCYRIGLDYVSCSPYRVPVARLSAAHATVNNGDVDPVYKKKVSNA